MEKGNERDGGGTIVTGGEAGGTALLMSDEHTGFEAKAAGEFFDVIDGELAVAAEDFGTELAIAEKAAKVGGGHRVGFEQRLERAEGESGRDDEWVVFVLVCSDKRREDVEIIGLIGGEIVVVEGHGIENAGGVIEFRGIVYGRRGKRATSPE